MHKRIKTDEIATKVININKAWELSKLWKNAAIIWRIMDHLFAIGSFSASVSVVFISTTISTSQIAIVTLSSISAILTLMGFACSPMKYMKNYRTAFQILNSALVSNTDEKGHFVGDDEAWKEIINAIIEGEKYIGKTFETEFDTSEDI